MILVRDMTPVTAVTPQADVCLIAEGCYPYVSGGVSSWMDWLIRSQPHLTFSVLAILPGKPQGAARYAAPVNLVGIQHLMLDDCTIGGVPQWPDMDPDWFAEQLLTMMGTGDLVGLGMLLDKLGQPHRRPTMQTLLDTPQAWAAVCRCYQSMPQTSFVGYFWAWRTLVGGLLRTLITPLPPARIYHAVSTGYAGLVSARATLETGRPSIITEHGIYSNERRIELLMADWIVNSIDTGMDFSDERRDIRDFWAGAFESFARTAYTAAEEVIALYADNNGIQASLGAPVEKLRVIPNGVDLARFQNLPARKSTQPTIAFIGRVTPIKDVQTFIDVAEKIAREVPGLRALIIGPMDEDPDYAQECVYAVQRRGLGHVVTFTGPVDVRDYFNEIDVLVLTSISEAQPLVILEAGAAGVPCVATDVGACREILQGHGGSLGDSQLAPGGLIAPVGDTNGIANAVTTLMKDRQRRHACGKALRERVRTTYASQTIANAYTDLYARHAN